MEFSLWFLLIPYGLIAGLACLFFLFNIFHIARYGLQSVKTGAVLMMYTIAFLIICIISVLLVARYDWSAVITLADLFSLSL
jgi:hypothetical protein